MKFPQYCGMFFCQPSIVLGFMCVCGRVLHDKNDQCESSQHMLKGHLAYSATCDFGSETCVHVTIFNSTVYVWNSGGWK